MTATIRLGPRAGAIVLDPVNTQISKGVLMTLEGITRDQLVSCILIPLDKLDAFKASLDLVASQVRQ